MQSCADGFAQAALDPSGLPDALERAARLFGGAAGQLLSVDMATGQLASTMVGVDPDSVEDQADYLDIHPRFRALASLRDGDITCDYDIMDDAQIARDRTYQELFRPNGVDWYAGTQLYTEGTTKHVFALFRETSRAHYSRRELQDFAWLSARVAEASRLAQTLQGVRARQMADTVGAWGKPVALLSAEGRVMDAGPDFLSVLRGNDLGTIDARKRLRLNDKVADGLIRLAHPAFLHARMDRHATRTVQPVHLRNREGRGFVLKLLPLPASGRWLDVGAVSLVSLEPLQSVQPNFEMTRAVLGLTASETAVCLLICEGLGLPEIATRRGVSYETVRSQTKSVLHKTGCASQTELRLLLARLF